MAVEQPPKFPWRSCAVGDKAIYRHASLKQRSQPPGIGYKSHSTVRLSQSSTYWA